MHGVNYFQKIEGSIAHSGTETDSDGTNPDSPSTLDGHKEDAKYSSYQGAERQR